MDRESKLPIRIDVTFKEKNSKFVCRLFFSSSIDTIADTVNNLYDRLVSDDYDASAIVLFPLVVVDKGKDHRNLSTDR